MAGLAASIIVNTRNEEANIASCLDAALGQRFAEPFEVIVVDSGSTDRTVDIVRTYPVKLLQTRPEQFAFGRNRNVGAEAAQGRYLVFLGADALPTHHEWLANLLAGFRADDVAGVYGRQVARDTAYPMEKFYMQYTYGLGRRVQASNGTPIGMDATWFSNVCSAMPRDLWATYPFSDTVLFGEDQEWSLRVLRAGYKIVYEPEAAVIHSHNYSLAKAFRRWINSGITSYQSYMPATGGFLFFAARGSKYLASELVYLARNGHIVWAPYALVYEAAKFFGLMVGRYHRLLPKGVAERLTFKY